MANYVIEVPGPFGSTTLRVVDEKWFDRWNWRVVTTAMKKRLAINEHGMVEAVVVDDVPDNLQLKEESGQYL